MNKILNFLNPDKISVDIPPPGLGGLRYSSFKDRIRFYCFTVIIIIAASIPCILIVLLLKGMAT